MTATYATSRTGSSKALSTYARPFQPQKEYVAVSIPTYTRPADWISVPTPSAGSKVFYILCAVWNDTSNFMALSVTGSSGYTVDWGDGSSPVNVATGVQANYNYSYSTVSSSVTTRGYKTVLITITPQSSGTLTGLNLNLRNPTNTNSSTGSGAASSPVLELALCSAAMTSLTMGSGTPNVRMAYCEKINIVENGTITSMASLFNNFHALQSITVPASFGTSTTDMSSMFQNCYKLAAAPDMVTSSVTVMNNMFQSCYNLVYVPDYDTAAVTAMGSMFTDCRSLTTAPNLKTSSVNNFGSMYSSCYSLINVPTINATAAGLTTLNAMFQNCAALKSVNIIQGSATGVNAGSMFQNCAALVNPPIFDYSKFLVVSNIYSGCNSIIVFPNRVFDFRNIGAGNGTGIFNNCYSLSFIDTIICGSTTSIGSNLFNNCYALKEVMSIDYLSLNTTFGNCYSLTYLPTIVNVSGVLTSAFAGCQSLTSISVNMNGTALGSASSAFSGCFSLKTINVTNLTSITGTTFASTFLNCFSIESAPSFMTTNSTASVTTWSATFQNCYNLREAPVINLTGGTTLTNMFSSCLSLQTVPGYTFSAAGNTNVSGMYNGCWALENIGLQTYGSGTLTTSGTTFQACSNLSSLRSSNLKVSFTIATQKFSGTQLNQVYTDLPSVTAQTITVTSNWGTTTDTPSIATAKGWTVTGS